MKIPRLLMQYERFLLGIGGVLLLLVSWELASRFRVIDPAFAGQPSRIIEALIEVSKSGELWLNARITLSEFALGFSIAVIIGLTIGLIAGWLSSVGRVIDPFLMAFNSTPRSALIPILIVWFGLGFTSKVVLVFMSAIVPIVINTITGVRTADRQLLQVARSFGASPWSQAIYILLPGAIPHIFSGLRLGLNLALIGVIIAEMYVSVAGFGKMIIVYGSVLRINELLAYILTISAFGCALVVLVNAIEGILIPWRH